MHTRLDHQQIWRVCFVFPQLSSDDVSASLGVSEESLQEDREEEQQESQQAPHPAGHSVYPSGYRPIDHVGLALIKIHF